MARSWLTVAAVLVAATVSAQSVPVTSQGAWDWPTGRFTLTLTAPLTSADNLPPPKRRFLAEQDVQRVVPQEFVRRVGELPVDSGRTLGDLMTSDEDLQASVAQLGEHLTFVSSSVDESYTHLTMVWALPLWSSLAPLVQTASEPNLVPSTMVWWPSRDFSGLVIFAMGDLRWWGTSFHSAWSPSMKFRLLRPSGEVVFDPSMLKPSAWTTWGQAGFSHGLFNENPWRDRIGYDPLRIVAWGVWGAHAGDLVLSDADWGRILSRPANRELLAEGRVLVLWGPFPDYTHHPNPDSAIDESKPPVEVIPEPPPPPPPPTPGARSE